MATRPTVSARSAAKTLRRTSRPTFIQRSRAESSEQKAIWHHVTGAGRSRVRRPFFDIDDAGEQAIAEGLETLVDRRLGGQIRE